MPSGFPRDLEELFGFLQEQRVLDSVERRRAEEAWSGSPEAETLLRLARALRQRLAAAGESLADGSAVESSTVDAINGILSREAAHAVLAPGKAGFAMRSYRRLSDPVELLVPIARSAAVLLSSDAAGRFGRCAAAGCGALFYDTTRNGRRRWCRMDRCGNRAKAAAHYRRRKAAGRGGRK
jgi:predicted RNA-binding Zn ribbon-like protein